MTEKIDAIIAEIRKYREEHAASFDFDPKRIVQDLQRLEREYGTRPVTRPPRKPEPIRLRSST
jgi:hypothetical protein